MAKQPKRKKSRRRGATARANAELGAHMASLGLEAIESYKVWCRQHGFSAALSKTWQERRQERAAHQRDQQAAQAEEAVRQHVAQLGLDGVAAYQAWCRQQGLGDAIHKSDAQRGKEVKLHQQIQSTQALHKGRKHSRRTKDIIHQLWAGAITEEELRTEVLRLIHRAFVGLAGDQRTQLRDLLLHVEKRAPNLLDARLALHRLGRVEGNTFVEALGALTRHSDAWQQSPSEWKPDSRNPRRQFAALVRFLLARYDVPSCLDSAWFGGWDQEAQRQQGWFVHVGSGAEHPHSRPAVGALQAHGARLLRGTKRTDGDRGPALGASDGTGRQRDAGSGRNSHGIGSQFCRRILLEHRGTLPRRKTPCSTRTWWGPIVDYINHQKYVPTEEGNPPQPNYTMKGRSAVKLLHQVEEWHERLARDNRQPGGSWESSGIADFEWMDDKEEGLRWTIRELTSKRDLTLEGRAMNHCVASYVPNCRRGSKSVWSMQVDAEGHSARVVTIAMHNPSRNIVEVRGRFNAVPRQSGKNPKNKTLERPYRELLARSGAVLRKWIEAEELGRTTRAY